MRSRSSGLMRMQVSESVSVKIWGEKHREFCVPDAPSSPCLQRSCGKLCGAEGGDGGPAQLLTCRKMRSSSSGLLKLSLG